MNKTQIIPYDAKSIEAKVTHNDTEIDSWIANTLSKHKPEHPFKFFIAGLDCKWNFHLLRSMRTKMATLQLCIQEDCLVLQLQYLNTAPKSLRDFLSNKNIVFVGVEIEENMRKLREEYGLVCARGYDLRALAKVCFPLSCGGCCTSLKALGRWFAGLETLEVADAPFWLRRMDYKELNEKQVEIACVDAYACCRIGTELFKELHTSMPLEAFDNDVLL
ncbi:hypothetical protein Droror1_Dr00014762 [Drosera rotundifolia]